MNRSKFSTKALMLVGALVLPVATLATTQPAAAQDYTCPAGTYYDPTYGCTSGGYIYPYSDYSPYGATVSTGTVISITAWVVSTAADFTAGWLAGFTAAVGAGTASL
jgi:hypothetical protein